MIHLTKSSISAAVLAVFVGLSPVLVGCTNTKYSDLMKVTAECDVVIDRETAVYNGNGDLPKRFTARDRIIALRERQQIMAERIDVRTMPEVMSNAMTIEQGEARKVEIVNAAIKRYNDAIALPIPTASTAAAPPAAK